MATNPINKSAYLQEIGMIRLVLIVLLVLYHAFAPFNGAWTALPGQDAIAPSYKWIAMSAYSFMLESFTFISGYIFGYQVMRRCKEVLDFKSLAKKKFKRLIIPGIVFSIIYLLIFNISAFKSPLMTGWKLLNGVGHMWYLPMLFWCFLAVCIVEMSNLSSKWIGIMIFALACVPLGFLPLQLGNALYYMLFFYLGYYITKTRLNPILWKSTKPTVILCSLYIVSFVLFSSDMFSDMLGGGGY